MPAYHSNNIINFGQDNVDGPLDPVGVTFENVETVTYGSGFIDIDFAGDFDGDDEFFEIFIDGLSYGAFGHSVPYEESYLGLEISEEDWAEIISDGTIDIEIAFGPDVQDESDIYDTQEFINLQLSWRDEAPTPDPEPTPGPKPPTQIPGGDDSDFIAGSSGRDEIDGAGGDDAIFAKAGNDTVMGGAGNDTIGGGEGNDELRGGEGDDVLFGGSGNDDLYGAEGNDVAWAGLGNDLVNGANGDDVLGGGNGDDEVSGGAGNDIIYGGNNDDEVNGDGGNDTLYGGAGDDVITGGKGDDQLAGGAGADTFVFGDADGDDSIWGFNGDEGDQLDVGDQTYTVEDGADGFAVIMLSGGGSIHIGGVTAEEVQDSWFI